MTRNRIALAAATAAAALVLPVVPANAHGTCNVYAGDPWETTLDGRPVIAAVGFLTCSEYHDPMALTACLYYTPIILPIPGTIGVEGLPPTARVVACGVDSARSDWTVQARVYAGCPYLAGYYQTHAFNGRAGSHTAVTNDFDYSGWVFIDGTACL